MISYLVMLKPILIVPDAHRPYHDTRAWNLMLKVGRVLKPYHLIVIGDLADFYAVSSHSKDPSRTMRLEDEVADVAKGLDELDALGATDKRYCGGNHEDRLTRYLRDKAPELFGLTSVEGVLRLAERGWTYVPYKTKTKLGKVRFTHDMGSAGRNSSFKALDAVQHSVVTGHAHRLQYIVEGNAEGEYKLSAQFGWLGDASMIDYMHQDVVNKNWALGFGVGHVDTTSHLVYLQPVPIVNYTCVVGGRLYRA